MGRLIDISGQKFGKLTVVKSIGRNKHGQVIWFCNCDCGNTTEVITPKLKTFRVKSCGCLIEDNKLQRRKNLIGKRFGRWTIIGFAYKNTFHEYFNCRCDCGTEKPVLYGHLTSGKTKSCGCLSSELASSRRRKDLTGKVIGRLTIAGFSHKDHHGKLRWLCKCSCGKSTIITSDSLLSGDTKSCGCYSKELSSERLKANPIHSNKDLSKEEILFNRKTKQAIRNILSGVLLRTGEKKEDKTEKVLGYSKDVLVSHIESLWLDGMTWDNHGLHGWHIDHIIPVSYFIKECITDPKVINALENLQPLWARDNRIKSNKYIITKIEKEIN